MDKMKVLFVDDEPRMLEGLQALLRKFRNRWDMHFVEGGEAAMKLLETTSFDVVVTDIRMPKVDGLTLLKHLQAKHPQTVRVVLSGDPGRETALEVVRYAHQALTKPCRLGELEAVLTCASTVRELVADQEVRTLLGRVGELPSLPRTYHRLVEVLDSPSAGPQQIAETLSHDIAVCAKILRLANSAIFGGRRQVTSVAQGISLIGTETIKGLVLSNTLASKHAIPAMIQQLLEDLQEHSLLVARVSQEIAGTDPVARRDAFSAGMLHDFGRLVLALELPQVLDARTAVLRASSSAPTSAACHARIGGYILGVWGLPLPVIDAVARHHDPPAPGGTLVGDAVRMAEDLVAEVVADDRADATQVETVMQLARERGRALAAARSAAAAAA